MDNVNSPKHYKMGNLNVEWIDIKEHLINTIPPELPHSIASNYGEAITYLARMWQKNGVEDARKAQWYINRLINDLVQPNYNREPRAKPNNIPLMSSLVYSQIVNGNSSKNPLHQRRIGITKKVEQALMNENIEEQDVFFDTYIDEAGKSRKMYWLTKKACLYLMQFENTEVRSAVLAYFAKL